MGNAVSLVTVHNDELVLTGLCGAEAFELFRVDETGALEAVQKLAVGFKQASVSVGTCGGQELLCVNPSSENSVKIMRLVPADPPTSNPSPSQKPKVKSSRPPVWALEQLRSLACRDAVHVLWPRDSLLVAALWNRVRDAFAVHAWRVERCGELSHRVGVVLTEEATLDLNCWCMADGRLVLYDNNRDQIVRLELQYAPLPPPPTFRPTCLSLLMLQ